MVSDLFLERLWVAQGCHKRSWAVLGASRNALERLRWHPQGGPRACIFGFSGKRFERSCDSWFTCGISTEMLR